ncbi:phosphoribosyl pyrophosphate synthase-associated protein 1-like isoform X2 [Corticium candelabrum]|uniref:phosphoribosyl pyrophosphate synthase-associated protein 1-like isoform X2 n=1 Tax=Corticium candelabrum TaxID=121492 RepID=UPI002E33E065|nr:phosphoribosyl pyrophosphate synthase-associated protein 1-like isoform X2 [Corticium candelabrum]
MVEAARGSGIAIFTGNSHPTLADLIVKKMGNKLSDCEVITTAPGETLVQIKESVRGKNVFIIQSGAGQVNTSIMELLIMTYACKTSCALQIIAVVPYLPYSKQSRLRKRGAIPCKLLAQMMKRSGVNHVITMDLHQKEIQGFFDFPIDNLRASPFLLQYIREKIPDYCNAVVVARHPETAKRVTSYAERLGLGIAVIHGSLTDRRHSEEDDQRHSPPPPSRDSSISPPLQSNRRSVSYSKRSRESERCSVAVPVNVVGDVGGRIAIIIDDEIDELEPFVLVAKLLKDLGAYKIYAMATHGTFPEEALPQLEQSPIDEMVITNTLPIETFVEKCSKIKIVDVSLMLAEGIRRIHNGESMSYLFRDVPLGD